RGGTLCKRRISTITRGVHFLKPVRYPADGRQPPGSHIRDIPSIIVPRTYYVVCDLCGSEKGTTLNGNLTSFRGHRGSKQCDIAKNRREKMRRKAEKDELEHQQQSVRGR
ncbi:hypothetical protein HHX47_DHR1001317, partial [Lentinula edodes]